jgi:hypothetical protein
MDFVKEQPYEIWSWINEFSDEGERDYLWINADIISALPQSVKVIIAFYSTLAPDYLITEGGGDTILARALGFQDLESAQKKLLHGREKTFRKLKTKYRTDTGFDFPGGMKLKFSDNEIIFENFLYGYGQRTSTDQFTLSNEKIEVKE